MDAEFTDPVSALRAGLGCKCPRRGLDFANVDSSDGPAVFVILILGCLVAAAALLVEVAFRPPYWLHMLPWLPTILIGALAMLRPCKATLIALQFKHKATQDIEIE